ncbi:hypothetical protein BU23DRAFT_582494 [Bimuria novae-zelandiae CBS 107.79]|uniref:ATP-grasp domain-containing protein n=1 Tax=Bimuria novae-zelandiae CBS 107.79 TaxID=1447943 RepID=A0A6A5UX98_9PLEO|nr:hypothetical protein BU23DRAFT_582494 [Bimuria novae-zelandiae CBS 107.79]
MEFRNDHRRVDSSGASSRLSSYKDSGADIANALRQHGGLDVVTPTPSPDPSNDADWANTIPFASHPLQTSKKLDKVATNIKVVGQPPRLVELYSDKNYGNEMLRAKGGFGLPSAQLILNEGELNDVLSTRQHFPVVGKPIRGRRSHGVKVCRTLRELRDHCVDLLNQRSSVIIEDYLAGTEGTVTFNHAQGIAPYNGVVAVTQNSRLVLAEEHERDPTYGEIQSQCVAAASLLQCTAPIRINVKRISEDESSPFALFDVNMKPVILTRAWNMTGPGRTGREDQASLTALAAGGLGWDYPKLLLKILESSSALQDLRNLDLPE